MRGKLDLEGGTYSSEEHGLGYVTNMFDPDGEETIDPRECYACVVRFSARRWLSLEVLEEDRALTVN